MPRWECWSPDCGDEHNPLAKKAATKEEVVLAYAKESWRVEHWEGPLRVVVRNTNGDETEYDYVVTPHEPEVEFRIAIPALTPEGKR